jgi:hypothetical protein
MQSEYKDQLPASLKALVDEIEAAYGGEIPVQHAPDLPTEMAVVFGSRERAWSPEFKPPCDSLRLTGLLYKTDLAATGALFTVPFAICAHELLHLRRVLVDRVPSVYLIRGIPQTLPVPQGQPMARMTVAGLENLLEHIVIEPRVQNYVPGYRLRHCVREIWDTIPPKPWASEYEIHWNVMDEWLNVQFQNENTEIKNYAVDAIRRLGWLDEARGVADLMGQIICKTADDSSMAAKGKEGMVLVACAAFRLPLEAVTLLYGLKDLKMLSELYGPGKAMEINYDNA